jgi:hypothetical protein
MSKEVFQLLSKWKDFSNVKIEVEWMLQHSDRISVDEQRWNVVNGRSVDEMRGRRKGERWNAVNARLVDEMRGRPKVGRWNAVNGRSVDEMPVDELTRPRFSAVPWTESLLCDREQGCQRVYFQTETRNLGKFWWVLQWKMSIHFMTIWYILWSFGTICFHLVCFMVIW